MLKTKFSPNNSEIFIEIGFKNIFSEHLLKSNACHFHICLDLTLPPGAKTSKQSAWSYLLRLVYQFAFFSWRGNVHKC